MAVAADRQRKLVVGNHGDGALFPRLRHGNDRSGRKRFCDKFQRVFAPEDNVYLFPAELFYDGVDPRAFISHAGAHGIDARIVGTDRHFRTVAGFAGDGLDLHDPLRDFGHLLLKQFLDEAGDRARNEDLRIFSAVFDALDKYLEPIAHHVPFGRRLILRKHYPLDFFLAELDGNVFIVHLADKPFHQLALLIGKRGEGIVALGFVQLLQDYLLGGLRGDTAEILGHEASDDFVPLLIRGIELLRFFERDFLIPVRHLRHDVLNRLEFDGAAFGIQLDGNLRAAVVLFFIRGRKRVLQRFYKRFFADSLFFYQIGKRRKKLLINHFIQFSCLIS